MKQIELFNPIEDYEMYFGNNTQQKSVINKLNASVASHDAKLHLVSGGSATGKTSIMYTLQEKFDHDTTLSRILPNEITHDPIANTLISLFEESGIEESDIEESGIGVDYVRMYKHASKPFYVVMTENSELPVAVHSAKIAKMAAYIKQQAVSGISICLIADSPVLHQSPPIFKPTLLAMKRKNEHQKKLAFLQKECGDIIENHPLDYDADNIRESIWKHAVQYDGQSLLDGIKEQLGLGDKTKEWKAASKALLARDRVAYDIAFGVLAQRMQIHESPRSGLP